MVGVIVAIFWYIKEKQSPPRNYNTGSLVSGSLKLFIDQIQGKVIPLLTYALVNQGKRQSAFEVIYFHYQKRWAAAGGGGKQRHILMRVRKQR